MNGRLDDISRLFRIPGFHHQKFKDEFKGLADVPKALLSTQLHALCLQYDKSDQQSFSQFKTRLRRYLFNRKGNRVLMISTKNILRLEEIKRIESLGTDNEVIDLLIFLYSKN
jgi:hypothetical protein